MRLLGPFSQEKHKQSPICSQFNLIAIEETLRDIKKSHL